MDPLLERLAELLAAHLRLDKMSTMPTLVSVRVAAERSGMSRRWFYDHKEAPFMRRLGPRTYRVDLEALEAWIGGELAGARRRASLPPDV